MMVVFLLCLILTIPVLSHAVDPNSAAVLDDFNRADASLTTPWEALLSTTDIQDVVSNALDETGGTGGSALSTPTFGASQEAGITVATKGTANQDSSYLLVCVQDGAGTANVDGYFLRYRVLTAGTDSVVMGEMTNGVFTVNSSTFNQEFAAGDTFAIQHVGDTLEAWYRPSGGSWASLGTWTDTTSPLSCANTKVGTYQDDPAMANDNFFASTIGAARRRAQYFFE